MLFIYLFYHNIQYQFSELFQYQFSVKNLLNIKGKAFTLLSELSVQHSAAYSAKALRKAHTSR